MRLSAAAIVRSQRAVGQPEQQILMLLEGIWTLFERNGVSTEKYQYALFKKF